MFVRFVRHELERRKMNINAYKIRQLGKLGNKNFNFIMCPGEIKLFFTPGTMVLLFFRMTGQMLKNFFILLREEGLNLIFLSVPGGKINFLKNY